MFQNLAALFESLNPLSFSTLIAYFGLVLGLVLALLFWFRHLLRFNRTQKERRRLYSEIEDVSVENQLLHQRLSKHGKPKQALGTVEALVAKKASEKLANQQQSEQSGSHSHSHAGDSAQDRNASAGGADSTSSTSTARVSDGLVPNGGDFNWESLDGVSPDLAAQLKRMGVRDVDHLESLSPIERESLEAKLAFEGQSWNWNWLTNWKTGASALAAGAAGVAGFAASQQKQDEANPLPPSNPEDLHRDTVGSTSQRAWPSDRRAPFELSIPGNDSPEVDWSTVDGVNPELAAEFRLLGIKNVEQLESLSESDRQQLEARLKSKGLSWDWGWLNSWKTGLAGLTGLGATAAGAIGWGSRDKSEPETEAPKSERSSQSHGSHNQAHSTKSDTPSFALTANSSPEVDWSTVDGVDPKLAAEFRDLGIKNVEQLESLSETDRQQLEARLKSKGLSWDWGWLNSWKTGLAGLAGLTGLGAAAAGAIGWGSRDKNEPTAVESPGEVNPHGETQKSSLSAWNAQFATKRPVSATADQAEPKSEAKSDEPSSSITGGLKPVVGFAAGVGESESNSRSNSNFPGASFDLPEAGGAHVDWSTLNGVDPDLAAELGNLGFQNIEQLESLSHQERQRLESNMNSKGISWDWNRLGNWKTSIEAAEKPNSSHSTTPNNPETDNEDTGLAGSPTTNTPTKSFTTPQGAKPEFKDDLTLLDGIEGPQAAELQKMGIFNFTQLHNLNLEERAKLQNVFRQRGWRLDMEQWRIASEGNTEHPSIGDIQCKAFEIYQDRDRKGFGGGERTDWEQAEWELRGNPIFSYGVPHDIDDFAVQLTGVTPEARDELYRMGLYNRHQLEHLGHDARRLLTRWFAGPRFGVDLTQSFGWLSSMDSVPTDKNFGQVFAIRPTRVDDLSDINGIGGPTEHDLNRIGIYQFEQIASWNVENILAVNELLNLEGRIGRDQWVVQAQRLVRQS